MAAVNRELDVVVLGATGFVGALTARYLARAGGDTRVALAGRSEAKLAALRGTLGPAAADWPLVVADTGDPAALAELARRTSVLATTVGPYARHGLPVVEACADAGTHYADLTGEVTFVRDSADLHHETAVRSGAKVVHACGFDSVPSELGVLALHERAQADGAGTLEETALVLVSARGGFSGGTVASGLGQLELARADPARRKLLGDPYALSPARADEPDLGDERDRLLPGRDPLVGAWVAPFVMASYNTRVVRRSNALLGHAYGRTFRYREVMGVGRGPLAPVLAAGVTAGLGAVVAGAMLPPTRWALDRVLPKAGSGPSEKTQQNGHFRLKVHTRTSTGRRYVATVAAKGDPGYAATAVMLGESALSLAHDVLPDRAGVLTPATAMGSALTRRLVAAGFEIGVEESRS